jgi:hypothetical protein
MAGKGLVGGRGAAEPRSGPQSLPFGRGQAEHVLAQPAIGPRVPGWWFESCNWPNSLYRHTEAPNFASFAGAGRAGNPRAIVAFNPGVFHRAQSLTPEEDYTSGEVLHPEL